MQITGNQNGFSFFSAYKVAAAPQRSTALEEKAQPQAEEAVNVPPAAQPAGDPQREGLLLQSAHRSAARAADWAEALAEY